MLPKTKSKPKHTLSDLTALVYGPSKIGKSTCAPRPMTHCSWRPSRA